MKKSLNPTLVYILSILGLLCCCFGGIGIVFSLPSYITATKKVKDAQLYPDEYEGSLSAMDTAKTVALIVLVINTLFLLWTLYSLATSDFSELQEEWRKAMEDLNATK